MPAAPCYNNFEGGTSGVGLSAANSGGKSGTAFDVRALGTGATNEFLSTAGFVGGIGCHLKTGSTGGSADVEWDSLGNLVTVYCRFFINFVSLPVNLATFVRCNGTAGTRCLAVQLDSTGHIVLAQNTNVVRFTSTTALSTGTWYRLELIGVGASGTGGSLSYNLYSGLTTTLVDTGSYSGQNTNTAIDQVIVGMLDVLANNWEMYIDALYVSGSQMQSIPPKPPQFQMNSGYFTDKRYGGRW